MPAELLRGEPVAADIREEASGRIEALAQRGVVPTLGTVLMSDDPAAERFMDLKHSAAAEDGLSTRDVRIDPTEPATSLYEAVDRLCGDPDVDGVFVQVPLPNHVSRSAVRERLDPTTDVDCFHPETLGRLVTGRPRFVPATPAAVCAILDAYDIRLDGRDVAVVGRSDAIGKPLANRLLQDESPGNATVTVCHSRTDDLASVTKRADLVVTAAGEPGLVDGSMLSSGAVVVDVSANRRPGGTDGRVPNTGERAPETEVVGDVAFESARQVARAITPVPGGVGPVTLAMLVRNVVLAAERTERSASGP